MTDELNILKNARDAFISYLKNAGKATSTILAYGNDIDQLITFLAKNTVIQAGSVTPELIEGFQSDLKSKSYTDKSISRKLNSIRTFFRFLIDQKVVIKNPTDGVTHPKIIAKTPRILTKMEYRALRDVCSADERLYAIVELFLQTGIRISELANLETDDIKKDSLFIRAYESHPAREVPLNKACKKALDRYLTTRPKARNKHVFITKNGKPFLVRNIRSAVERHFKLADIDKATVNDLRHTFITHQLKAGTPLVIISKIVGHKRLSTTEKYLKYIGAKIERESMRLEEL